MSYLFYSPKYLKEILENEKGGDGIFYFIILTLVIFIISNILARIISEINHTPYQITMETNYIDNKFLSDCKNNYFSDNINFSDAQIEYLCNVLKSKIANYLNLNNK